MESCRNDHVAALVQAGQIVKRSYLGERHQIRGGGPRDTIHKVASDPLIGWLGSVEFDSVAAREQVLDEAGDGCEISFPHLRLRTRPITRVVHGH